MAQFQEIVFTPTTDVATNGTLTLSYPSGQSSSTVSATGAKMFVKEQATLYNQGASNFSVAYGGSIVVTYLGATTIKAGSSVHYWLPVPAYALPNNYPFAFDKQAAITVTTDSTGGTAGDTAAAITAPAANATTSLTADMGAVKNAIASLVAKQNTLIGVLKNAGLTS